MESSFDSVIENTIRLASYWHKNQLRFGGEFIFFTHPSAVATMLARNNFSAEVIAAGFGHDLLECTDCPIDEIHEACGELVAHLITAVTENNTYRLNQSWIASKELLITTIRTAPNEAKAVYACERIHNLQTMIALLEEHNLTLFKNFVHSPEEALQIEDQSCMALQSSWQHPLLLEYDALIDEFVELLEELDIAFEQQGKPYVHHADTHAFWDIDSPEFLELETAQEVTETDQITPYGHLQKIVPSAKRHLFAKNTSKKEKTDKTLGKYLDDTEYRLLLPAALQLGISSQELTNPSLQEHLGINYLLAFKILKECKRLHVIKSADGTKPRQVQIAEAKSLLAEIRSK